MDEKLLKHLITEMVNEMDEKRIEKISPLSVVPQVEQPMSGEINPRRHFFLKEVRLAKVEKEQFNEIVIAIGPGFGTTITCNVIGIPLKQILRELISAIEQQSYKARIVQIWHQADIVSFAAAGCQLSGSGIAIAIQADGAILIQRRNSYRIWGLEAYTDASLLLPYSYYCVASHAVRYAKGEQPTNLVPQLSDISIKNQYQAKSMELCAQEAASVVKDRLVFELELC